MSFKDRFATILRYVHKHAIVSLVVAIAVACLLGTYAFRGVIWPPSTENIVSGPPRATPGVPTLRDPLTGYPVAAAAPLQDIYAVAIDDMVDAWPQSGVDQAFLVIEAPVEAGIPRLLAFYSADQNVQKIGPIRSARPYFIDWADEFDAMYAHVGGSDAALAELAAGGTFDFNQFSNGTSFWRSTDRQAPHNVYTSTQLLGTAWERLDKQGKAPTPNYGVWQFKDSAVLPPANPVSPSIGFTTPSYKATWQYDPITDEYQRFEAGLPFVMQDGSQVWANNVAVMITTISTIDTIGHRQIITIGSGDAMVFQDGLVINGTWKKDSQADRLRFYDSSGNEIQMNTGKTWIEVVAGKDDVTY